jgi:hypothetical protein
MTAGDSRGGTDLAREHIRAHDFDERGDLFIRIEKPCF